MAGVRANQEKSESKAPLLLLLLALLIGLGAWNYRRNVALENAHPSPYATVSDHDLDVLIAAYQSEIDAMSARGTANRRASAHATSGVAGGVREFERVQRTSRAAREAGYEISEREGAVEALKQEKARRIARGSGGALLVLRRAFSF
jgi:hypothetical protein